SAGGSSALGRSTGGRPRSSKVRVPHRPRTDPAEAGSPERDDRPEPPHRGGTRKTVALGPGCAAPSCPSPSRIAPGRRNHARRLSSTDFCNTIGTSQTAGSYWETTAEG